MSDPIKQSLGSGSNLYDSNNTYQLHVDGHDITAVVGTGSEIGGKANESSFTGTDLKFKLSGNNNTINNTADQATSNSISGSGNIINNNDLSTGVINTDVINGHNNTLNTSNGIERVTVSGDNNTLNLSNANNTVTISSGSGNTIHDGSGATNFNINSRNTTIDIGTNTTTGSEVVNSTQGYQHVILGDGHHYNTQINLTGGHNLISINEQAGSIGGASDATVITGFDPSHGDRINFNGMTYEQLTSGDHPYMQQFPDGHGGTYVEINDGIHPPVRIENTNLYELQTSDSITTSNEPEISGHHHHGNEIKHADQIAGGLIGAAIVGSVGTAYIAAETMDRFGKRMDKKAVEEFAKTPKPDRKAAFNAMMSDEEIARDIDKTKESYSKSITRGAAATTALLTSGIILATATAPLLPLIATAAAIGAGMVGLAAGSKVAPKLANSAIDDKLNNSLRTRNQAGYTQKIMKEKEVFRHAAVR